MLYILDSGYNTLKTFNFTINGTNYIQMGVDWCVENNYELVSEKKNSLGDLFWIVKKM